MWVIFSPSFFLIKNYVFIYFWLLWVFIAACSLSLIAASGGYNLVAGASHCHGFSLQTQAPGLSSLVAAHGFVAVWHDQDATRDETRVPCIAQWILNHWTTRETLTFFMVSFEVQKYLILG